MTKPTKIIGILLNRFLNRREAAYDFSIDNINQTKIISNGIPIMAQPNELRKLPKPVKPLPVFSIAFATL